MKRYWFVMALFLAGLISSLGWSPVHASAVNQEMALAMSPGNPTETEIQVMQHAAPMLEMSYQELYAMFQNGEATIEQDEDANWVVTAYVSGGNILIVVLESTC